MSVSNFSENELLTLRTASFDGRKAAWIASKDEEATYVKATIVGDGKVRLRTVRSLNNVILGF